MPTGGRTFSTCRVRGPSHRTWLWACCWLVLVAAAAARADDTADNVITLLPPIDEEALKEIQPQRDQTIFDRIRLAALGDPQDLTEPLLPDDVAPPGQPRQEFEPPAGRKLPPGAKLSDTDAVVKQVTAVLRARPEVKSVYASIGSATQASGPGGGRHGTVACGQ